MLAWITLFLLIVIIIMLWISMRTDAGHQWENRLMDKRLRQVHQILDPEGYKEKEFEERHGTTREEYNRKSEKMTEEEEKMGEEEEKMGEEEEKRREEDDANEAANEKAWQERLARAKEDD